MCRRRQPWPRLKILSQRSRRKENPVCKLQVSYVACWHVCVCTWMSFATLPEKLRENLCEVQVQITDTDSAAQAIQQGLAAAVNENFKNLLSQVCMQMLQCALFICLAGKRGDRSWAAARAVRAPAGTPQKCSRRGKTLKSHLCWTDSRFVFDYTYMYTNMQRKTNLVWSSKSLESMSGTPIPTIKPSERNWAIL